MNILFIEDEKELAQTAVAQLELRGHQVDAVNDLAAARNVMEDPDRRVDLIIADHRLPDGLGIRFAIEMKTAFPDTQCVIVSGCLTPNDIELLEANGLPYYRKPLLYGKVVDELRRSMTMLAPQREIPQEPESESDLEPSEESPEQAEPKKKGLFGFFCKKGNGSKEA